MNYNQEIFAALIGGAFALITALLSLVAMALVNIKRYKNEKRVYAINMIKEWNYHCIRDTKIINKQFPNCYKDCKVISKDVIKDAIETNSSLQASLNRLFNYFEYISFAYRNTANQKIVLDSFGLTMVRYTRVLQNYLLYMLEETKRNHWVAVTGFISRIYKENKSPCKYCSTSEQENKCYVIDASFKKVLADLNNR